MTMIRDNLQQVTARIVTACTAAGRQPARVRLLAVSKTFPPEAVQDAHAAGQRAFGENYIQEGVSKIEALADLRSELEWHCIGPLQSNKTRLVAEQLLVIDGLKEFAGKNEVPDGSSSRIGTDHASGCFAASSVSLPGPESTRGELRTAATG